MSFKKLVLIFCLFVLTSCTQQVEPTKIKKISVWDVPDFIVVKNKDGFPLGKGFLVQKNIGIMPDHLYETDNELFINENKIEILARDFENDILAFRLKENSGKILELSNTPPHIGKQVYWFDGETKSSNILAVGIEFEANSEKKINLISFSGETVHGASGGVVFDESQKVWGMIIGADTEKKEIFAVRSDVIKDFIKNNN